MQLLEMHAPRQHRVHSCQTPAAPDFGHSAERRGRRRRARVALRLRNRSRNFETCAPLRMPRVMLRASLLRRALASTGASSARARPSSPPLVPLQPPPRLAPLPSVRHTVDTRCWSATATALAAAVCATAAGASTAAEAEAGAPVAAEAGAGETLQAVSEGGAAAEYPVVLPGGEALVGAGMRLMTPLKVPVYAVGLYVDAGAASRALASWGGAGADALLQDGGFWERVSSPASGLRRTVRMVTVREVSGAHMESGFRRGLAWRVKAMGRRTRLAGGRDALRAFSAAFRDAGVLRVGTEVLLCFPSPGRLLVVIDGQTRADIDSPVLVWAVLQMFYGEQSVAPNVKARVASGFADMLRDVPAVAEEGVR